ncbi:hypothetical protein A0H81_11744 [Grifola frondosa]|uniref:Uncharacterized protein n=1 Tax=Grifola frondosa TaxID=5627 RepID=A0A1C7LUD5_GRIFR|nr:hypothetical protein A0H81_11744 [Grifola frondosa]
MQLTAGLPLLFALGARLFLNFLILHPGEPPSVPDLLLNGLFQGVLIHNSIVHFPQLVFVVVFGVAAKLLIDLFRSHDSTLCAYTLLGVALGVLCTDVLSQIFDHASIAAPPRAPEPAKRTRLVSFTREAQDRDRDRARAHKHTANANGHAQPRRHDRPRRTDARPSTPALSYCSTAPSISLDSVPSSIDPEGRLTPEQRAVAVLRAKASLADSERRRFKEERKWALSQGNTARASQLAWQVKRYAALMESFHREADAKVVAAARAVHAPVPTPGPSKRTRRTSHSKQTQPITSTSAPPAAHVDTERPPVVSVTVAPTRTRKRSGGRRPCGLLSVYKDEMSILHGSEPLAYSAEREHWCPVSKHGPYASSTLKAQFHSSTPSA